MQFFKIIIIIIIIIKTSRTGPSGKTKLFINLFRNLKCTCATENWKNTSSSNNKQLTDPLNPSNVPVWNTCSVGKVIFHIRTWAGKKHVANWDANTLTLKTLLDKLIWQLNSTA